MPDEKKPDEKKTDEKKTEQEKKSPKTVEEPVNPGTGKPEVDEWRGKVAGTLDGLAKGVKSLGEKLESAQQTLAQKSATPRPAEKPKTPGVDPEFDPLWDKGR